MKVFVDGETLTMENVVAVARHHVQVEIPRRAREKVENCRRTLEEFLKEKRVIYGVTTGYGALCRVVIPPQTTKKLQSNLIRSHSAGVGKRLEKPMTRALMLLRANVLAKGYSGIKLRTLETLVEMINKGVHPVIPEKGSVGASGDLAPLSHMALVIMGEGEAEYNGRIMSGKKALEKAGLSPVELDSKEGTAMNNGSTLVAAIGALGLWDAERLVRTAEIATAMSLEAMCGISDAFDERIHRVRPYPGQITSARNVQLLTTGSKLIRSSNEVMKETEEHAMRRPHDPYCLRCAPQILGAARDAIAYARSAVEAEMNSAADNPLIFIEERECLSGGNFHGQPLSIAMDLLGIALTAVGNISERKIARLIDDNLSGGLPAFLVPREMEKGLSNGFVAAHLTASALASENKVLAHPASVDSIPTAANSDDVVSMGPHAARKAMDILRNLEYITAIELLCAAQGIDLRGPDKLANGTYSAYSKIRQRVPMLKEDRVISKDIETIVDLIQSGQLIDDGV